MKHSIARFFVSVLLFSAPTAPAESAIKNHQLYYQEDTRVPMTSLTLVFHGGGAQQEKDETAGLAGITAKMLFRGTPSMEREVLARRFELLGADVNASASETDFTITISCFTRNVDEVLSLVGQIMNEADFPEKELELVRKQELNGLEAALQNPEGVLRKGHEYVVFNHTRFGKFGSKRAVEKITRDDVRRFFSGVRGTRVLYFAAISDIPRDELEKKLTVFTQGRRTDGFSLKPEMPYATATGREAVIFNSPGATNDRFIWSHRGLGAADDRRFDLDLIIDALGSSQGLLFDELRNKNGWCYGAYASAIRGTGRTGLITYYADPTSATSDTLIPTMLQIIRTFADNEGFQQLLARRNDTFKNRYAYQLDLRFKLASEVSRDRYGIPILDRDAYFKRIDTVTQETARKVIREVFDTTNVTMVFNGDAERIKGILKKIDPSIRVTVLEKEVLIQ
jgi:zinc protease